MYFDMYLAYPEIKFIMKSYEKKNTQRIREDFYFAYIFPL